MTGYDDILQWIREGQRQNAKYMLVCTDTFDYEDYPVYCKDLKEAKDDYNRLKDYPMTRVMECYNLSMDIHSQLNEERAFHLE